MRYAAYHKGPASPPQERRAGSENPTPVLSQTTLSRPAEDPVSAARLLSYRGVTPALIKPVFRAACALRFSNPGVTDIIDRTNTRLDREIVGAILEGALRLLPVDNTPEGQTTRRANMAAKAEQAMAAEETLVHACELSR